MRDRLVELLDNATVEKTKCYPNGTPAIMYCEKAVNRNTAIQLADKILADGWFRPPCKVGQTVYRIVEMSTGVNTVIKRTLSPPYKSEILINCKPKIKRFIRCVEVTKNNFFDVCENWGKIVFLTKEEAEQALKGGVEG